MALDDKNKLNRLEELKRRLSSRDFRTEIEHRDSFTHTSRMDVPDSWTTSNKDMINSAGKFFMKTSFFKKFFIFSIVFFALALGYAFYAFFGVGNTVSNDNIDISVVGNAFTAGGEELPLVIGITNRNNSALDLVDLVMEYPKSSSSDLSGETEHYRQSLGTIPAGSVRNENVKLVLFGEQGSVRPIKISIEYRVEGSNAIFVKDKMYEVTISSTPIDLSMSAPDTISPNQDVVLNIKSTLNATKPASNVLLKLDYPVGFQFSKATPAPSIGNNVWSLGDLAPGAERDISITGRMVDVFDGEQKNFHASIGSQSANDKSMIDVLFNSLSHSIVIKKPFIEAKLFVNGVYQSEYASDTKTTISGEIHWANNLETRVDDLSIQAKISGNAVDRKSVKVEQGNYDSSQNIITWDKTSKNDFAEVNPGDSGVVIFSVDPLSLFSSTGGLLASPSINIDVSIAGKQSVQGFANTTLTNSESKIIRIISDVGLSAKALYYSGPFQNTGAIPPKVEKETTYTVVWTLSNTSNNISKTTVRSTLPPWIRFVGTIAPESEDLSYNSFTKEIVWNVGAIPKGTGIASGQKSVSFQVGFTPSLSQVGLSPALINDAVLTGHDDFASVDVRVSRPALRIQLDNDPAFPSGGGAVVN